MDGTVICGAFGRKKMYCILRIFGSPTYIYAKYFDLFSPFLNAALNNFDSSLSFLLSNYNWILPNTPHLKNANADFQKLISTGRVLRSYLLFSEKHD